jgi:hypothetical protein
MRLRRTIAGLASVPSTDDSAFDPNRHPRLVCDASGDISTLHAQ